MTRDDLLTMNGVTQPIAEWALDYGIPASLILTRLNRGMSTARAITKPMRAKPGDQLPEPPSTPETYEFDGQAHTIAEWAKITGISQCVLRDRIRAGWQIKRVLTTPTKRGRVSNFSASMGTGAGSDVQAMPKMGFSEIEDSP
ncbi:hypothetical protein [Nitratireductor alexandrii]|uniref:hypothetical protein n=1 Tax=Nitratireductor alexandrii TaxID=2448161 RepID=UPI000FDAA55C|nr:hypothetical protein [Nitratireductor alexandrii]